MKLTSILHRSSYTRYSTSFDNVEYTGVSSYELELLKAIPSRLRLDIKQEGFTHTPFRPLPYDVTILTTLPSNIKHLFDADLSHPVLTFKYKNVEVDSQILQSTGVLKYDHACQLFNLCSDIATQLSKYTTVNEVTPIFGLTEAKEVALYIIPESNIK